MSVNKLSCIFALTIFLLVSLVSASEISVQNDIYTLPSSYVYGDNYNISNSRSVLTNDVDVFDRSNPDEWVFAPKDDDGNSVWAVLVNTAKKGTLNFTSNGSFVYVANNGFPGVDSFTYYVTNGNSNSSIATAYLGLRNNAPSILGDLYILPSSYVVGSYYSISNSRSVLKNDVEIYNWSNLDEDGAVIFDPRDEDGDSVWAVLVNTAKKGTLNFTSNGSFVYVANNGFHGVDYFTYLVSDGHTNSLSSVYSYLSFNNSAPVAVEDRYAIIDSVNTTNATGVLANDSDFDGDELELSIIENVKFGKLKTISTGFSVNGSFNYTSNKTNGVDYFVYELTDHHKSDSAKCIFVIGTNTDPVANNDSYYTSLNKKLNVSASLGILANDNDANDDVLFIDVINSTQNGSLSVDGDGSFVYTPDNGFVGVDNFTYYITDLDKNSENVTVTIYVNTSVIANVTDDADNETIPGDNVTVNVSSEVYPLVLNFQLYNGNTIVNEFNFTANDSTDVPTNYSVPTGLVAGNYTLYLSLYSSNDLLNKTKLAEFEVEAAVSPIIPQAAGGGGGGGTCNTQWSCTEWTECSSGSQTRTCSYPTNYCAPRTDKPLELRTCTISNTNTSNTTELNNQTNSPNFVNTITGNVIGTTAGRWSLGIIVFLIVIGLAYWIIAKKRKAAANAKPIKVVKLSSKKSKK